MIQTIREYQREGIRFIRQHRKVILGDEPGMGKTVQILLGVPREFRRWLVVAPQNALYTWKAEILKWRPDLHQVVHFIYGTKRQRTKALEALLQNEKEGYVVITTYGSLIKGLEEGSLCRKYDVVVADEFHKRFRRRRNKTAKVLKGLQVEYKVLISGSPIGKDVESLWVPLNVLYPKEFSSFWRFAQEFSFVEDTPFGKEYWGFRNLPKLRTKLRDILIRRKKKDYSDQFPPKTRQRLVVEMSKKQKSIYEDLSEELLAELSSTVVAAPSKLPQIVLLRKLLCSPKLLDQSEDDWGAGLEAIIEKAEEIPDRHFMVATTFRGSCDVIRQKLLKEGYPEDAIFIFRGGMSIEELERNEKGFKEKKGVAICTMGFAQSFNLETASYAFILGPSFVPDDNEQAEDRIHRATSKNPVTIYYVMHKSTIEEHILDVNSMKVLNVKRLLENPNVENLKKLIKGGPYADWS